MSEKDNAIVQKSNKKNAITIDVWEIVNQLMKTPALHVKRDVFLREKLSRHLDAEQLNKVISDGNFSEIDATVIDDAADDCINKTRLLTAGASFITGLPSSLPTLPATASADIIQSFGFYLRIAQELAYLYGEAEDFSEMDGEDKKVKVMLFLGSMFGIAQASAALVVISKNAGPILSKKFNQIAVTKIFGGVLWKIAKGIANLMGIKLTKEVAAKGISKVVPIIGGVASGILTYVTFEPMVRKLQNDLREAYTADDALIEAAIETIENLENSDIEASIALVDNVFNDDEVDDGETKREPDGQIEPKNGIAAVDAVTLKMAAAEAEKASWVVTYPDAYDVPLPATFSELAQIEVNSLRIRVTIDTGNMSWGITDDDIVAKAGSFRDYAGKKRYCVRFLYEQPVSNVLNLDVTRQAMRLKSGRPVYLWAAEVPAERLFAMSYPDLYELACNITKKYDASKTKWRLVTIPAVQIRFERSMDEISGPKEVIQKIYMSLDETGARVKAITRMDAGMPSEPPEIFHFGEKHPVVYWLTECDSVNVLEGIEAIADGVFKAIGSILPSTGKSAPVDASKTPFAVIATTTDAWLDPGTKVSFRD